MLRKFIILNSFLILIFSAGNVSASGGVSTIQGGDEFTSNAIENGYTLTGQGFTVTIIDGVATITKDNNTIKVSNVVEVTGNIDTRKVEAPLNGINGIIDTGVAASGGVSTAPVPLNTSVTAVPVQTKDFGKTFFRKFGIE